jgi:AbrB family looped-hinge helix DNA binding protein
MLAAKLTSKGQITIPKDIRQHLKIDQGDKVEFFVGENGVVIISPIKSDVRELKGIIPKPQKPVSLEDMEKAIIAGANSQK